MPPNVPETTRAMTYKVELDIYNGPMDLLLYLIRREEVDIRDIQIARIADQYIAYLGVLEGLDIELAGDFVVMAATLLEMKSRALLPRPPAEEEDPEAGPEEDPRETLIGQLLEYRRFKDAALDLDERGREMARRFPRQFDPALLADMEAEASDEAPGELLAGIEVWDLISAFSQVVRTLGYSQAREVVYDDTPIEQVGKELVRRLETQGAVRFIDLFRERRSLPYCISLFLAILELIRQRRIGAEQPEDFKELRLFLRDPASEPPPKPVKPKGAAASADAIQRKAPRRPSSRQTEQLRQSLDEVDLEKTEFDEILDAIQVPDVEAYKPVYSDAEIMGKGEADDEPFSGEPKATADDPSFSGEPKATADDEPQRPDDEPFSGEPKATADDEPQRPDDEPQGPLP
jgi:segregation and condensation protein A